MKDKKKKNRHSGVGRIAKIVMRSMSLYESNDSTGQVSIEKLFNDPTYTVRGESKLNIMNQVNLVCRGGWPVNIKLPFVQAIKYIIDYYNTLVNIDIIDVDGVKRNANRAKAILRTYARNISTLTDYQTMLRDLENIEEVLDKQLENPEEAQIMIKSQVYFPKT